MDTSRSDVCPQRRALLEPHLCCALSARETHSQSQSRVACKVRAGRVATGCNHSAQAHASLASAYPGFPNRRANHLLVSGSASTSDT
jgi:hypothetical protein